MFYYGSFIFGNGAMLLWTDADKVDEGEHTAVICYSKAEAARVIATEVPSQSAKTEGSLCSITVSETLPDVSMRPTLRLEGVAAEVLKDAFTMLAPAEGTHDRFIPEMAGEVLFIYLPEEHHQPPMCLIGHADNSGAHRLTGCFSRRQVMEVLADASNLDEEDLESFTTDTNESRLPEESDEEVIRLDGEFAEAMNALYLEYTMAEKRAEANEGKAPEARVGMEIAQFYFVNKHLLLFLQDDATDQGPVNPRLYVIASKADARRIVTLHGSAIAERAEHCLQDLEESPMPETSSASPVCHEGSYVFDLMYLAQFIEVAPDVSDGDKEEDVAERYAAPVVRMPCAMFVVCFGAALTCTDGLLGYTDQSGEHHLVIFFAKQQAYDLLDSLGWLTRAVREGIRKELTDAVMTEDPAHAPVVIEGDVAGVLNTAYSMRPEEKAKKPVGAAN